MVCGTPQCGGPELAYLIRYSEGVKNRKPGPIFSSVGPSFPPEKRSQLAVQHSRDYSRGPSSLRVTFSTFTTLCNHHPYLVPEHFHHPRRPCPHGHSLPHPNSPAPGNHQSTVSMDLPALDISDQWDHTLCGILCHNVFEVHPRCSLSQCLGAFYA